MVRIVNPIIFLCMVLMFSLGGVDARQQENKKL